MFYRFNNALRKIRLKINNIYSPRNKVFYLSVNDVTLLINYVIFTFRKIIKFA